MSERPPVALAPVFCIRAAGVPFDVLASLGTPEVAAAARALLAAERAVDQAGRRALARAAEVLGKEERGARRALKRLVRNRRAVPAELLAAQPWLSAYQNEVERLGRLACELDELLEREALRLHREVRRHAVEVLPDFATLESEDLLDELERIAARPPPDAPPRSAERDKDRTLALYLQRVCAKSDTISRFGPSGWGRIAPGSGMRIAPAPGIAARSIEVERWVVIALIEVMNRDPDVRPEVAPRLHPCAAVEEDAVVWLDTGQRIPLQPGDRELLARCDGAAPAHGLGDAAALARLAEAGAIIWELERYAVDSSPLASLIADVEGWRQGPARARWLPRLARVRELADSFGRAEGARCRRRAVAELRAELASLGVARRERGRTLYAAANPVLENCFRECGVEIGAREVERLLAGAAPWFDLFRDAYALAVSRAFERYQEVIRAAPRRSGRLSYAELVAFARSRGVLIDNDRALVQAGAEAFDEVKRALSEQLAGRPEAPEWQLGAEDCEVLRRRYQLPPAEELSYPQVDLQIAASSVEEIAAGRYTWIVAELHHPFVQMQHVMYWACPDKPALHRAMAGALCGRPYAVRGSLTEQPVHVSGESVLWAVPRATFVGAGRPKAGWPVVRPADAEVVVDEEARDVRLRAPSGEDLGSLVRGFRVPMGMHPFFPFERAPHAPRLRVGDVVVQRRTWHVTSDELDRERPVGVSRALLTAVERLRAERDLPRWVFARPAPGALRTFDAYGRDKDLKPFYVDLESALFLDIFERRLRKYGELILSEMLPAPDQLVWAEPAGRFVFELRASAVPAGEVPR